jgi:hypothetical protein
MYFSQKIEVQNLAIDLRSSFVKKQNFAAISFSLGSLYDNKQFRPSWIRDPESK